MTRKRQPCGTNAAYQRHIRAGEEPDAACRKAHNAWMNAYPRGKAWRRARSRALARLSHLYPTAYESLLTEELAKEEDYR